jgi:hypothetical protein
MDLESIEADLLIENIELAFDSWEKYPWNNHLSFDQFCEYILPYKCLDEKPEKFRSNVLDSYKVFLDSLLLERINDPVKVCSLINDQIIKRSHLLNANKYPTTLTYSENDRFMGGPCENYTTYAVYVMRAIGIPVSLIYSPQDGNRGEGVHYWNAVLDTTNKHILFQGGHMQLGTNIHIPRKRRAKIYQVAYAEQSQTLPKYRKYKKHIPYILNNKFYIDVTDDIVPSHDISLCFDSINEKKSEVYFICVFNNKTWIPIHWSTIKTTL